MTCHLRMIVHVLLAYSALAMRTGGAFFELLEKQCEMPELCVWDDDASHKGQT